MNKPYIVVVSDNPLQVRVKKNGRAVSMAVAKAALAKQFPGKKFEPANKAAHGPGHAHYSLFNEVLEEPWESDLVLT